VSTSGQPFERKDSVSVKDPLMCSTVNVPVIFIEAYSDVRRERSISLTSRKYIATV